MQNRKRHTLFSKHSLAFSFAVFLLACSFIGVLSFQYYQQLQTTIRSETNGYLKEIASRIGDNIDRIILDNFANIKTIATILEESQVRTFAEIAPIAQNQREYWNFEDILFINEEGKAYNSAGNPVVLNNDTYFTSAIVEKKPSVSNTQMVDGQERILLSVPLERLVLNGEVMVAAAASYNPSTFDQTLSMASFDGASASCIIDKSGIIVVRSANTNSLDTGYNVLATISNATLDKGSSIDTMKQDMQADLAGQIGFTLNGERYYVVYTPINPENWYLMTFVPASVVNARSDTLLQITVLACGLVTLVSAGLIALVLFTSSRNKRRLENLAYVDEVTGGNTIEKFFELAQEALRASNHPRYALAYSNIEKFKLLNEQYGEKDCDHMLYLFYKLIEQDLTAGEIIGRQAADNFCILLEYKNEDMLCDRVLSWYAKAEEIIVQDYPNWTLPNVEFGFYVIDDESLGIPQMIDRAKLALRSNRRAISNKAHCAFYNDQIRRRLMRDKELEDRMEAALANNEFRVYLQPKYHLPERRIGGAEALVRWQSKSEGMIFPDEFIPLFERNGFITQIDLWVFEQVCGLLRTWIDKGYTPPKISVNCSRIQLRNPRFLDAYCIIADRHAIPRHFLEIELTESIVMEDSQRLIKVIEDIRKAGFGCSVDDFGSGYSSLNLIQAIPVDTMKLDRIFFNDDERSNSGRMALVVKSIIGMAKALSMETVAEGVEEEKHVRMLEEFGCDYVQGYVFARPVPVSDFEKLAFGNQGGEKSYDQE